MVISTSTIGLGDMSPDWTHVPAATLEVSLMAVRCVLVALAVGVCVEWYDGIMEKVKGKLGSTLKSVPLTVGRLHDAPLAQRQKICPTEVKTVASSLPPTETLLQSPDNGAALAMGAAKVQTVRTGTDPIQEFNPSP
jgi:hypothetical protein